jgi:uncharacterized membrane protein YkvA (DUF1232 family)
MAKAEVKSRMKNLLLFLPNLLALCWKLLTDNRVSKLEKAMVAGAIVYAVMPLDFIPDLLPFVGQVDDAYLIALTLMRLLQSAPAEVVREHWRGGGDVVPLLDSIARVAPMILPKRVSRVLSAQVEPVGNAGKIVDNFSKRKSLVTVKHAEDAN